MTENYEKLFFLATAKEGDVWHEVVEHRSGYYRCSCGEVFAYGSDIDNHINQIYPTYSHADEILNRMRDYCGEERYAKFFYWLAEDLFDKNYISKLGQQARLFNFVEKYILDPPSLLKKAGEFLKGEGK